MNAPELPDFPKLAASAAGAFVSLIFRKDSTPFEKVMLFIGGSGMSYTTSEPIIRWLGGHDIGGLVYFWVGLLGMAVAAKAYDVVQVIDAKDIAAAIVRKVRAVWKS